MLYHILKHDDDNDSEEEVQEDDIKKFSQLNQAE